MLSKVQENVFNVLEQNHNNFRQILNYMVEIVWRCKRTKVTRAKLTLYTVAEIVKINSFEDFWTGIYIFIISKPIKPMDLPQTKHFISLELFFFRFGMAQSN